MKKSLFLFVLICGVFCFGGKAWAATYYVSTTGLNTNTGLSWAQAVASTSNAVTKGNSVAGGNTIYVGAGTYLNDAATFANANWNNGLLFGVSAAGVSAACSGSACQNYPAHAADTGSPDVFIEANATNRAVFAETSTGITVKNISANSAGAAYAAFLTITNGFTCINCYALNNTGNGFAIASTNTTITDSRVRGSLNSTIAGTPISTSGTITGSTINNLIVEPGTTNAYEFSTDTDVGSKTGVIINSAHTAGTLLVSNSILSGGYWADFWQSGVGGTLQIENSILYPAENQGQTGAAAILGYRDGGTAIVDHSELVRPFVGYIATTTFTGGSAANLLAGGAYPFCIGIAGCTSANTYTIGTPSIGTGMQKWFGTVTDTNNVDHVSKTGFTSHALGGFVPITIDDALNYNHPADVASVLRSHNVRATWYMGTDDTTIPYGYLTNKAAVDPILADTLNDGSYMFEPAWKSSHEIEADPSYISSALLATFEGDLPSNLPFFTYVGGTNVYSLATPGGATGGAYITAAVNAGLTSVRGNNNSVASSTLTKINLYTLPMYRTAEGGNNLDGYFRDPWDVTCTGLEQPTCASTQANMRQFLDYVSQYGTISPILLHTDAEMTPYELNTFLTIAQNEYPEVKVGSMYDIVNYIKTSGLWTTSDNQTYTRTLPVVGNYHLTTSSVLIGAGKYVGINTDFAGSSWNYYPNIGAYTTPQTADVIFYSGVKVKGGVKVK